MKTFLYFKSMRAAFQGSPFSVEWPNRNPNPNLFSTYFSNASASLYSWFIIAQRVDRNSGILNALYRNHRNYSNI